jgi:glyoxylase-like metal-dependent hydrolase (beta-lactamase superfamily II)
MITEPTRPRAGDPGVTAARPWRTVRLAAWVAVVAATAYSADPAEEVRLGNDLEVRALRPGYWRHVSKDGQGIPANGMIVRTPKGLLLVDTGWTEGQAERLVAWGERALGAFFVQAIVTHSHGDRTGGIAALTRRGIPVAALDLTIDKLRGTVERVPRTLLTTTAPVHPDPLGFEAFYPGAGHALDNIVVWFPAARILFGGCLVKSEAATELGNTADADLASWPRAVKAVLDRYPTATLVVPGHGAVGTTAALTHTMELPSRRPAATP